MTASVLELKIDSPPSLSQSETDDVNACAELESIKHENDCKSELLLSHPDNTNNDIDHNILKVNGYKKICKIRNTLQGALYKASVIEENDSNNAKYVAIKTTSKFLLSHGIAVEDGTSFCVSENIIKEALILKYLTVDNETIGNYIIKYIDFFESDTDYYLVTEYIHSAMNLKQFVHKADQYIKNGKLLMKEYRKIIKYILWQLFVTCEWLHSAMHCCHLDLCAENIMLQNATFTETKDGICIDPNLTIKICDWGVSEVFECDDEKSASFLCVKQGLTLENECYAAPNIFNIETYDAQLSDNWSLGMILFECMTMGAKLYEPMSMHHKLSGYHALHNHRLKQYLVTKNIIRCFKSGTVSLLTGLLDVDEKERLHGMDILQNRWFKMYYQRYYKRIIEQINEQKQKLSQQKITMKKRSFPFYVLSNH